MCDVKTHYTCDLEVYAGKQPEGPYKHENTPSDIVKRLVQSIKGSRRNVTVDNWYTSYPLACDLLNYKLTLVGTVKKNKREIPAEFLPDISRKPTTTIFGFQDKMTLVSYTPKKNRSITLAGPQTLGF